MKRLIILTIIAMLTMATSSGCRTCGSPLRWFNRGIACDPCSNGGSEPYTASYGSDVAYQGDTMLPPVTSELLPGPRPATQ